MNRPGQSYAAVAAVSIAVMLVPSHVVAKIRVTGEGVDDFHSRQTDYVLDGDTCGQGRISRLQIFLANGTRAKVGSRKPFSRSRTISANVADGQAVKIRSLAGSNRSRLYVFRCLPDDFPEYIYKRVGKRRPSHEMFAVDPISFSSLSSGKGNYAIIFSRRGSPIWWRHDPRPGVYLNTTVLPDGKIAMAQTYGGGGYGTDPRQQFEIFRSNGRRYATVRAVGSTTDNHEIQETRDGNFLIATYVPREQTVDASSFNGDASAHVVDSVVQKVSPSGELLWSWDAGEHVALSETGRWWDTLAEPYDIHHLNSIDIGRNGNLLVSMRHTDAVYKVDGETGAVIWKLGGTQTFKSVNIRGDDYGHDIPLGGQHDARLLARGKISIHANQTDTGRQPRAVVYRIRDGAANLVRSTIDPAAESSSCCGSARVLPGGNWLISWGGRNLVTELTPGGNRRMMLEFAPGWFSYRAQPVPMGATTTKKLRKGMDTQFRK